MEVEGSGEKNVEDVDFLFPDHWMYVLNQLWTSYNRFWVDSETSWWLRTSWTWIFWWRKPSNCGGSKDCVNNGQGKGDTISIQTGIWIHVWKQPRVHNHCSFCLFNLKNEGFCIVEVWRPHVVSDKLWNDDLMIILSLCVVYLSECNYL